MASKGGKSAASSNLALGTKVLAVLRAKPWTATPQQVTALLNEREELLALIDQFAREKEAKD